MLPALRAIASILESGLLDCTGELKSELAALCMQIRERAPGFEDPVVAGALGELEEARRAYIGVDPAGGAARLVAVSAPGWPAAPG